MSECGRTASGWPERNYKGDMSVGPPSAVPSAVPTYFPSTLSSIRHPQTLPDLWFTEPNLPSENTTPPDPQTGWLSRNLIRFRGFCT